MTERFEIVCEVNCVGSYGGDEPFVSLVEARAFLKQKAKRGKVPDEQAYLVNVGELKPTREQAKWFGARLYRKIRITFEDIGAMDDDERAERERQDQLSLGEYSQEWEEAKKEGGS